MNSVTVRFIDYAILWCVEVDWHTLLSAAMFRNTPLFLQNTIAA